MHNEEGISILGTNIIFLFGIIILVSLDLATSILKIDMNMLGISTIIIEFLFFLVPSCLYIIIKKKNLKKVFRINKLSLGNSILVVLMMQFSIPLIGCVNYIIQMLINTIGRPLPNPIPEINTPLQLLMGLIAISLTPAICEEIMARGIFMRGYEQYGTKTALIVSAALFSIMHRNIQSFIPIFLMGLLLGYVVYRTNSIFAGILVHFTNNSFSIFAAFLVKKLQKMMGPEMDRIETVELPQINMITSVFLIIIVISSAIIFIGLLNLFRHNTKKQ